MLGGSHGVLSTEIFFAVVGSQNDPSRAAVLAIILLCFTLTAFLAQRFWLSGRNFATVTGKGDSGAHAALPRTVSIAVHALVIPWALFTLVVYGMILVGGFVKTWGLDNSLTLAHYIKAFSVEIRDGGIAWTGVAWNSFWTTMEIALISAPLTAAVGLLTAYLIVRQRFAGRELFEFALMMSFAIPGTVIGISYIMAFNLPPLEMTGSALILVACFVFRNMPVGVRGGVAAMSQLDRSLDEASLSSGPTASVPSARSFCRFCGRRSRPPSLFLRARDHFDQRRHLLGQRRVQHGDGLYRRAGRERRIRRGDRLFLHADRGDDSGHRRLPACRRRTRLRRENRVQAVARAPVPLPQEKTA